MYHLARQTSIWGEDALEFRPERWLDANKEPVSQYQFVTFNAGPRICLGKSLALLELKTAIATLYRQFHFELKTSQPVTYGTSLTLPMKHPLRMKVSKRVI